MLLGFGSYPLFLTGWSSNRKYGIIGSLRGIAQTISYEISLALILFTVLAYINSLTINSLGVGPLSVTLFGSFVINILRGGN